MSVAVQVNLRGETSELLVLPNQRWNHRTTAHLDLTNCCGVLNLRSLLGGSKPANAGNLVTLECVGVGPQSRDIPAGNVHREKNGLGKFRTRSAMPDDQVHNAQMSTRGAERHLHRYQATSRRSPR